MITFLWLGKEEKSLKHKLKLQILSENVSAKSAFHFVVNFSKHSMNERMLPFQALMFCHFWKNRIHSKILKWFSNKLKTIELWKVENYQIENVGPRQTKKISINYPGIVVILQKGGWTLRMVGI